MPEMYIAGRKEPVPHMATLDVRYPKLEVWHYTGASGLLGIMNSTALWASSPLALNDSSEISYGVGVINEAWQELAAPRDDLTAIQREYGEVLASESLIQAAAERVYFLCATRDEDSLSQWQGYARAQGYAIRLGIKANLAIFREVDDLDEGVTIMAGWYEVVYDRDTQKAMASDMLSYHVDRRQETSANSELDPTVLAARDLRTTATLATRFKHPAFRAENEVRYVTGLPGNYPEKFRDGPRGLIPFVELASVTSHADYTKSKAANLPITKVMCGPAGKAELTPIIAAAKRLLTRHGYNVEVVGSAIPYRFS